MTVVSNDPSLWPFINASRISSYFTGSWRGQMMSVTNLGCGFAVAGCTVLIYDRALAFGQDVELVWRKHWSPMTVLYLSVCYLGIIFAVINILSSTPTISITDVGCLIESFVLNWTIVVANALLGAIMVTRLHAMYQHSRKVLILLVVIYLAVNITSGVVAAITMRNVSGEVLILSGTYHCTLNQGGDNLLLDSITWILGTVWEVLALCLAVWIAIKHFRELRQQSAGGIIGDFFPVLMKTHVVYFASFVAVSCLNLVYLSPMITTDPYSPVAAIYSGSLQMLLPVQIFVLGPRLILSVRKYNAKLVADSDATIDMTSIVFQEPAHVSTSNSV